MNDIPVIGFAAWSGVGKTTLIRRLIPALAELGLRTAVIKHDVHGLSLDRDGRDSRAFVRAGAQTVLTCGPDELLISQRRSRTLDELLAMVRDVDLILVEGFKEEPLAQIGLCRAGQELPAPASRYVAVVTDRTEAEIGVPTFAFADAEGLARFLSERLQTFRYPR